MGYYCPEGTTVQEACTPGTYSGTLRINIIHKLINDYTLCQILLEGVKMKEKLSVIFL